MTRFRFLIRPFSRALAVLLIAMISQSSTAFAAEGPARGADELFWVPTLEQALAMAKVTGRPLFLMGYSLVGDGTTYTKFDSNYCTGVF